MHSTGQTNHTQTRAQAGLRASFLGLALNLLLSASKFTTGLLSGSVSILADGINNLTDSVSVLISLASLRAAQKPGDREHPFGHGRMEYIGTLAISVIILYVGIDLLRNSALAIIKPREMVASWLLLGITAISIPVKLFMWRFYLRRGRAHGLPSLLAAAQDSFNDVLVTSAVALGYLCLLLFGIQLDGWMGALVSLFILYSGFNLIRETITSLIGGKPDRELGVKILAIINKYPEIIGVHDFLLHDYGPGRTMASIHVEVPSDVLLLDIHEVVDQIEQEVLRQLGLPITIHMDPVLPATAPGQEVKASLEQYLLGLTPPLSLHDFRMVPGKRQIKLVFDVVVPAEYHNEQLTAQIADYARSLDPRYQCVIRLDPDYFTDQPPQVD